jgi:hypothetical protein
LRESSSNIDAGRLPESAPLPICAGASTVASAWIATRQLEDVHGESTLPMARRGRAAAALEGGLPDQLAGLEHEAGVRQQL